MHKTQCTNVLLGALCPEKILSREGFYLGGFRPDTFHGISFITTKFAVFTVIGVIVPKACTYPQDYRGKKCDQMVP